MRDIIRFFYKFISQKIFYGIHYKVAICKSRNGELGNGMRGMVGMRGITVGVMGMRGMRGIRVGMMGMWGIKVGMIGIKVGMLGMRGIRVGMRRMLNLNVFLVIV